MPLSSSSRSSLDLLRVFDRTCFCLGLRLVGGIHNLRWPVLASYFSLLISYFSLLISYFSLLISYFSLLISYFSLLISYFSLLISYFSLLTSHFLFLTSYFSLHFLFLTSYFSFLLSIPVSLLISTFVSGAVWLLTYRFSLLSSRVYDTL